MRRRKRVEEHINHERWLVSYADFITLLFAFFVVMYSISSVNEGKFRVLSDTLEATFTDPTHVLDPIQVGEIARGQGTENLSSANSDSLIELPSVEVFTPPPVDKDTIETIKEISEKLNVALKDLIDNKDVIIKEGEDWLELEMKSKVLFYSGEARLEKTAVPIIGKIADILRTSANAIQVEGFTDNNPISTARYPSNWELSAARAASVVHLLDRYGLKPSRMSAIGYGEFKPIADNSTIQGQQNNRRVVLVVLGKNAKRRTIDVFAPPSQTKPTSITTAPQQMAPIQIQPSTGNAP